MWVLPLVTIYNLLKGSYTFLVIDATCFNGAVNIQGRQSTAEIVSHDQLVSGDAS